MSGIYIHIPFCTKACTYCNFHFTTSLKSREPMVKALVEEIKNRKDFLGSRKVSTVYLGGGTPSLLPVQDIAQIMGEVHRHFTLENNAEVTIEANPENIRGDYLTDLESMGFNRVSLGIQSFSDDDLEFLGRVHGAQQALAAMESVLSAFPNTTIDLIYGIPGSSDESWNKNLNHLAHHRVPHFAAYALTVEPKTALAHYIGHGRVQSPSDAIYVHQYEALCAFAAEHGYEHYEISNFARPGYHAVHNTAYWQGARYLGIGPSAHSFDGHRRRWNISNNALYIRHLQQGTPFHEDEVLTKTDRFNEYLLTSLRTKWGLNLEVVYKEFGKGYLDLLHDNLELFEDKPDWIETGQDKIRLTERGLFLSDHIISSLFLTEDMIHEQRAT